MAGITENLTNALAQQAAREENIRQSLMGQARAAGVAPPPLPPGPATFIHNLLAGARSRSTTRTPGMQAQRSASAKTTQI